MTKKQQKKRLAIVTNTFFAEEFVNENLDVFRQMKARIESGLNVKASIIVVDDGSKDNTVALLAEQHKKHKDFTFIKLTRNFGAVYSHLAGLEHAFQQEFDAAIHIASDMQDPADLMWEMAVAWLDGSKFVMCVRSGRRDGLITKTVSAAYYWIFKKIGIPDFPRSGFDLFLIDRQVLTEFIKTNEKNYAPQQLIFWLGFEPKIIFYERQKRLVGQSGWTLGNKIKLATDTFVSMSYFPIRTISYFGILVSLVSFVYGGFVIYQKLLGKVPVEGWTSVIAIMTFLLGTIIVILGVIAEYLWRTLDQIRNRPRYVIDFQKKDEN